ncbi:MAG: histidine kinase dimerization/phosphoacceptor domain -containing protein [Phenylobacterium sp.]|uniref:sensor histidine kinase n=1 Tax=Phenylobacterium sp. TaxID=1871053 RepID=UPI0027289961|nr:histidine kinase dimerization/phosphoacceptor domain -containing protein [Phenylobacterium sp.]MDO9247303.1 histidine kinase dimerization/phosphoacceptor domain -containing protein [Phenylobacterium sp.]MDP3634809.1 histidine kinase dimerization/phosphoacceptor domain -containing protein [Phenylobacterium sp.]
MPTSLQGIEDAQTLAQAIVDTIHEPLLVLDAEFRVLAASRSFYAIFQVDPEHTIGRPLYWLGDGQWNIAALRVLLETIIPERVAMDGFEVEHDFPGLGARTMLLNARKVIYERSANTTILLAFTDITARRAIEREKEELLERTEDLLAQQQTLLQEMQHRVANSLQIIASILMIKARAVTSEETRQHLSDAHQRVMSVAEVQAHLHASGGVERIEVGGYLTKLCASLAKSMIGEDRPIILEVVADGGEIGSDKAVSIGLIVTELLINAVKYAFPAGTPDAQVMVTYTSAGDGWTLTVADNGVGKTPDAAPGKHGGLGTVIVDALVKQLGATMKVQSVGGVSVSITHAASVLIPQAA